MVFLCAQRLQSWSVWDLVRPASVSFRVWVGVFGGRHTKTNGTFPPASCITAYFYSRMTQRLGWFVAPILEGHPIHIWRKSIVYTDLIAILTAAVRDFGSEVEAIERKILDRSFRFHKVIKLLRVLANGSKLKSNHELQYMKKKVCFS